MDRSTRLVLLCLTCFLVLFPLVVGKPGMPLTLKADEPAYYLMSLSLAIDGDLRCEPRDLRRWFDEYPAANHHRNLILMSDDGWKNVFFGKPFIYSAFAAPAVRFFGANGLVAFNMLLLMAMVWMGASYLARFNTSAVAALFSAGFFLLSVGFAYVFWLQPELFNMASVMTGLYLALHEFDWSPARSRFGRLARKVFNPATLPAFSGAALAFGVYNKPVLAAFALPALYLSFRRRGWKGAATYVAGAVLLALLVAGTAIAFTGHPSAYLGVSRGGFSITAPDQMPTPTFQAAAVERSSTQNSWTWIFRIPDTDWSQLWTDSGYFLWGRHTGLIPYTPFAVLAVGLFLLFGRRSPERWLTLAALVMTALFFLIWIPFNWHGGGGFVGNRYFINAYPAFLFLVTHIRPLWTTVLGYAAGGVLLGPILFTPFGAPVKEPTLQAHVRNPPFHLFPLELSLEGKIPGYRGAVHSGLWFYSRKDVFRPRNDEMWLHGAQHGTQAVELWVQSHEPLGELVFEVRNQAPGNRIEIGIEGAREVLEFPTDLAEKGEARRVALTPKRYKALTKKGKRVYAYRMTIDTRTGQSPAIGRGGRPEDFYLGAALTFLGTREQLAADLYHAAWETPLVPSDVSAGEPFEVSAVIENRSQETWPSDGPTRVNLSYHWLDSSGATIVQEGRRSALPAHVGPGRRMRVTQKIWPPDEPGEYTLVLDPVRERVAWFSEKNAASAYRTSVRVGVASDSSGTIVEGSTGS